MTSIAFRKGGRPGIGRAVAVASALGISRVAFAEPAFAATGGNIENMANAILDLLTGPLAKTAAAIAIVVCGYMYFTGRGSAQLLVTVIVGCFLVFSSKWLIGLLTGG